MGLNYGRSAVAKVGNDSASRAFNRSIP